MNTSAVIKYYSYPFCENYTELEEIIMGDTVRVRIAPSPTGNCHVGTARTALYNMLYARKTGGKFVLRIDDTDLSRSTKESEEGVLEGLRWLGIKWDEGPDVGGPYAPYRQMERHNTYKEAVDYLLAHDLAYKCYCTKEELDREREEAMAAGKPPRYYGKCARLTQEQMAAYEAQGRKPVIRIRVPSKRYEFDDILRGHQEKDMGERGDFVIVKSDGSPVYNFATVVDEHLMDITHVMRAVEHLTNTFDQLVAYDLLGWKAPLFGHLTLMLNPDRTKISKRAGAVYIGEFRQMGYLPEALVNFLALLGWNPGDEREMFTMDELVEAFSLENLSKSDAIFDMKKLDWFNGEYIRKMSVKDLADRILPFIKDAGLLPQCWTGHHKPDLLGCEAVPVCAGHKFDRKFLEDATAQIQERITRLTEAPEMLGFLFTEEVALAAETFKDKASHDAAFSLGVLKAAEPVIEGIAVWEKENIEAAFREAIAASGMKLGDFLMQVRVALTGKRITPPMFESMHLLGKEACLARVRKAKQFLESEVAKA